MQSDFFEQACFLKSLRERTGALHVALELAEQVNVAAQIVAFLALIIKQRFTAAFRYRGPAFIDADQVVAVLAASSKDEGIATRKYRHVIAIPLFALTNKEVLALAQTKQCNRENFAVARSGKYDRIVTLRIVKLGGGKRNRVGARGETEIGCTGFKAKVFYAPDD